MAVNYNGSTACTFNYNGGSASLVYYCNNGTGTCTLVYPYASAYAIPYVNATYSGSQFEVCGVCQYIGGSVDNFEGPYNMGYLTVCFKYNCMAITNVNCSTNYGDRSTILSNICSAASSTRTNVSGLMCSLVSNGTVVNGGCSCDCVHVRVVLPYKCGSQYYVYTQEYCFDANSISGATSLAPTSSSCTTGTNSYMLKAYLCLTPKYNPYCFFTCYCATNCLDGSTSSFAVNLNNGDYVTYI